MRGHAIANRLVIAVNRVEPKATSLSGPLCSRSDGFLLKDLPSNLLGSEKIQISFDEIEENRRWWPHFRDRH